MKEPPAGLDPELLVRALVDGWDIAPTGVDHLEVGFGSYHWDVRADDGGHFFVTVDDLDDKPWLGTARHAVFEGLSNAFGTAYALATECGLDFVIPPVLTRHGEPVRRADDRYALCVHPFLQGTSGHFGQELSAEERSDLIAILADLHRAAPRSVEPRVDVPLPGRRDLETALQGCGRPWSGGPYSEPARAWLRDHAATLTNELATFDVLAGALEGADLVVTHGEPHPGNVLRVDGRPMLIDWDTVALAPRERDLFMVGDPGALAQYVAATGCVPDSDLMALYRLAWDLGDVASFVDRLRAPHVDDADTRYSWTLLAGSTWLDDVADGPAAPRG